MNELLQTIEFYTERLKYEKQSNIDVFVSILQDDIFNSNKIENNTLTYSDVVNLLSNQTHESNKKYSKDEIEILAYKEALDYVMHDIYNFEINEDTICNIQYLLVRGVKPEEAGLYRRGSLDYVGIRGSSVQLLEGHLVEDFLQDSINMINYECDSLHPLIAIARFKQRFVYTHPFFDGNGRTSRILMNTLLLKIGYYPFVIKATDRQTYFKALEDSMKQDDIDIFVKWWLTAYLQNLKNLVEKCCDY